MTIMTAASGVFYVSIVGPAASVATARKIESYKRLPHGWHYGQGGPAAFRTIQVALGYLSMFMGFGFIETDAFPGVGGEIMVTAYRGKHCVEVTVEVDNTYTVSHQYDGDTRFYEPGLSAAQTYVELTNIV